MSIVEELSGSESLEIEAPTTEPERQYYFIGRYFRADRLCGRTGRGESRFCYL